MELLLTGAYKFDERQIEEIQNIGYKPIFIQDERFPIDIDVDKVEVVVCNGLFLYNDISKFKNLKHIQLTSAGTDRVPLNYLHENKINLYTAKDVYSIPMAEWVVLKILEIYKSSNFFRKNQEEKTWEKKRDLLELTDKVITIVGCGNVGLEVAKRLKSFGTIVYGISRTKIESPYIDGSYTLSNLDELLKKSDILIVSIPLTQDTKYLFNKNKFKLMKDNSVLVNISRGSVINEEDLIEAIESGKFLGIALDVMEKEPLPIDSKLWDNDRIIITPHNSFVSDKINERLFNVIKKNLSTIIENGGKE